MPRHFRVRLFLIWLGSAVAITLILGSINWPKYYRLAKQGVLTEGSVTQKEPENHQIIRYSYFVGKNIYNGVGHDGFGNPSFEEINVGERVKVHYLPKNPEISCLGNPSQLLENETIPIIGAALVFPSLAIVLIKRIKKKWVKGNRYRMTLLNRNHQG